MSAAARLSLQNWWATAAITGTASAGAGYEIDNAKTPERPLLSYRSTSTAQSEVIADLGSAKLVELVLLLNVNFASATIQANATNSWGAPTHDSGAKAIAQDPWTGRYTLAYVPPSGFTLRWNRILIPSQAPIGGATYFELGGVYAGPFTALPAGWAWGFDIEAIDPRLEVEAELGRWTNSYAVGDRFVHITATRRALITNKDAWATGDELAAWLDLDRQWRDARFGAFWLNRGATAHAWVPRLRRAGPWKIDYPTAESQMELEEVLAG